MNGTPNEKDCQCLDNLSLFSFLARYPSMVIYGKVIISLCYYLQILWNENRAKCALGTQLRLTLTGFKFNGAIQLLV
jgi:hypothetical protein